ncbi:ATP-grasp domain-containing protein [Runella sp. CRIBMP]|uniref:ATP-grasp domain-containing protein n=1 Tax=Runella sp. CRIBMP TaxID=2683261 RepID=UPI0014126ADB|nr:ATP-grasp domain-containing protein [Runella sp. CRIBMP]NBB18658.1 ATP-grasp domain-containing protein [Runella sp. CRIBMP]
MFSTLRSPLWLVKLVNYEYWTWWVFFLPLTPYWLYLAIRNRSLTYFTTVNTCIPDGGVFGESKNDILAQIASPFLPAGIFIQQGEAWEMVREKLKKASIVFPVIVKPDVGGRGFRVHKIEDSDQLQHYLKQTPQPVIIQEYIDYELEFGVMYARLPEESKGKITSITQKEFLSVVGDGHSTVGQLLTQNTRARFAMQELQERVKNDWNSVVPKGERRYIQPIGNHCLGTKFLNANHLINQRLESVFDQIALPIEGFYYGRFDLKVSNLEDFYAGRNIKIMELNGATSEPGHVYDPSYTLWKAYRDIMHNMRIVADISAANIRLGVKPTPLGKLLQTSREFFAMSGQL